VAKKRYNTTSPGITGRKGKDEYKTIIQAAMDGFWLLDMEGRFLDVNDAYCRLIGYSRDELLKMSIPDIEAIETPKETAARIARIKEVGGDHFETRHRRKDGRIIDVEVSVNYIDVDGGRMFVFARDISERKQAEELYQTLAKSSPVGVYIFQDGKFCFVNPQFSKLTGYSEDALLNMAPWQLVYPEDRARARGNAIQMLKGNLTSPYQFRVIHQGGEIHWAMETVSSIHYKGKRATLGNFMDITEQKRMEQELQQKNEQLDAQNEELQSQAEELMAQRQELIEKTREVERATRLKSEFLANMSHELRTPLNVIIGFSQLMVDEVPGKINEEQRQCLNDILTSSQHLLNLINGVLDLSRIESGKVELKPENVALAEVIASLTRTMTPILVPRTQSLDVEIEEGLPPVYADEGKLAQVLLNLVDNASKFTPDGGMLKVRAVRQDDWCQVSVIDNGIGIKDEDQERIFEPFTRLEDPLIKDRGGTGLGLALVKQVVERYGGRIWVESEYGKGSCFTFTLPLATGDKKNPEKETKP